jgi:hypothetical protein
VPNFEKSSSWIYSLGAFWFDDNGSFVSNSKVLGEFLLIHPHSINANFREHSFTPLQFITFDQLRKFRPSIQGFTIIDGQNWKQRKHKTGTCKSTTTIDEARILSAHLSGSKVSKGSSQDR